MPSNAAANANAYLRTQVLSASPEQLRLMLIEGAIRFTRQGRDGLSNQNPEQSYEGLAKARDILMELMNSLRPEVAPELCEKLTALYTYMFRRLIEASSKRDIAPADEVLNLLEYDRQTWKLCMAELAASPGPHAHPTPEAGIPAPPGDAAIGDTPDANGQTRPSISFEG